MAIFIYKNCRFVPSKSNHDQLPSIFDQYEHKDALIHALKSYYSTQDSLTIPSSGTTGQSKPIYINKQQIIASARHTLAYFSLKSGNKALLCLNPNYIGGKMMIFRALIGNLVLYIQEPDNFPLQNKYLPIYLDFAAMVPLQLRQSIVQLRRIRNIIVGGGTISEELENQLWQIPSRIYATFAMTETVSHFALRNINNKDNYYQILDGVKAGIDHRNCLWVQGDITQYEKVQTNDIVEFTGQANQQFVWKGRADNVINSGGIKIIPEALEPCIKKCLLAYQIPADFFLFGIPDDTLGNKLVLALEAAPLEPKKEHLLLEKLQKQLPKYQHPKKILYFPTFIRTSTHKVKRLETVKRFLL